MQFHDRIVDSYRFSMRGKINMASLWRRASRKVIASFDDFREPRPHLDPACPFRLEDVIDPNADLDRLVDLVRRNQTKP